MNLKIAMTLQLLHYIRSAVTVRSAHVLYVLALILLIKFYLLIMFFSSRFVNVYVYTL